jgi:hypothetical protein
MKVIDRLSDLNVEYVNLLVKATPQQFCYLLQTGAYYSSINELNINNSTGESSPVSIR